MSLRRCLRAFSTWILATSLTLSVGSLWASVGFQPVSQDELKMTSEPQAPGAPAIILYREVNRDDFGANSHGGMQVSSDNSIQRYEENYRRIKILTEEGRKYADIEIPLLHGYHNITGIGARTIRPDGSIINFDGKIFEKTIFKRKGVKYQAKTFTLTDVQVGSIIEYYYTINFEGWWIWNSEWIVSDELFQKRAKFTLRPFSGEYSLLNHLRWSQHLPPGVPEPQQDSDGIVHLDVRNISAFQTEDFMPPENELKARVDFIYSLDTFEPDVNKFWRKVGKKRNDELESFIGRRGALEKVIAQVVAPNDSQEDKLQKLYARVQQLRNTSYEVQKTEEQKKRENQKDLANAEEVLKRGYGTEDQLNWLYVGLVRAAGFEAYGVAVSDRGEFFFNPQNMNGHRLDQSAVLVKLNAKDSYFDPGAAFAPFGLLKWEETGVQGLRLDKDGGTWIQTAVPDSSLSQVERTAELKLSETGDLEGKLKVTFTGLEGLSRRAEERNEDEVAKKKYLEDEVKQYIPAASELHLSNNPDWGSSGPPLVAEFDVKIPGWVSRGGKLAFLPVGLFGATERHLFDYTERIHPIYFEFPAQKLDDISIDLPAGWQVSGLPQSQNQDYRVVAYSVGAEETKGTLHIKRKMNVNIISMDTKYYGPLRSFFQGVKAGDDEKVILQAATTLGSK
jgi:Domain of Unknown Function with PDB structure (DUF3857)